MTIKELCLKYTRCDECPFENACDSLNCTNPDNLYDKFVEVDVTRSIIETARILHEDECPKIGAWILKRQYGDIYFQCPKCGAYFLTKYLPCHNYCPNCGAKMR